MNECVYAVLLSMGTPDQTLGPIRLVALRFVMDSADRPLTEII